MPSKRFKKLPEKTKDLSAESIEKLLPEVKKNCTTKFDESVDLSFQINNKQKKSEVNIRTVVNLPGGTGKKVKVAVVCEDAKAQEATDAGADIVGSDEFIEKIKAGELNFEKLICTPGMMIKLSKLGKVLGPKGLMPNPKLGSVSEDIKKAVTDAKSGQAEISNDKDGNIGVSIGKKSFTDEKLIKNYNAILESLEKEKSNNSPKGDLIKSVFITSTMGVSYKIKLGKKIFLYGASTKGNTLLQYYGLTNKEIPYAAERTKTKWGKYTVGSGVKILSEEDARKLNPDYFFVMPYGFINEFIKREKQWLRSGGKFILPYPKFKVIK